MKKSAQTVIRPDACYTIAAANGRVLESGVYRNPATGQWRMTLRVERLRKDQPIELRAFLQHLQHAVSETWTHVILPE